jgi:hypothetical protein
MVNIGTVLLDIDCHLDLKGWCWNVDAGRASGHGGGAWGYSDGILVPHIWTYIFHYNLELILVNHQIDAQILYF